MPKAKGSEKQASKEEYEMSAGEEKLFSVLCTNEDIHMDICDDLEDDCDAESLMSSRAGSIACQSEVDGNESDEEPTNDMTIAASLRHLANVRKKPRSDILYAELLGSDGEKAMEGMDVQHMKEKAREHNKEMIIRVANQHFENKMQKRNEKLAHKREQSYGKLYRTVSLRWRDRYRAMAEQCRGDVVFEK